MTTNSDSATASAPAASPLGPAAYQDAWSRALAETLAPRLGADLRPEALSPEAARERAAAGGVWLRFSARREDSAEGGLAGEHAFAFAPAEAILLAQLAAGERPGGETELTAERRDAAAELMRAVAEAAAKAVTAATGVETRFHFEGAEPPAAPPASVFAAQFAAGEDRPALVFVSALDQTLTDRLEGRGSAAVEAAVAAAEKPAPGPRATESEPAREEGLATTAPVIASAAAPAAVTPPPRAARSPEANLDLLLDVPLDVTLRFGGRQMVLKEILELGPGAVVELDRGVEDPVELLVAGRVVAQGEVVIVDGNYGLRVTEIAAPQNRLSAARALAAGA